MYINEGKHIMNINYTVTDDENCRNWTGQTVAQRAAKVQRREADTWRELVQTPKGAAAGFSVIAFVFGAAFLAASLGLEVAQHVL